MFLESIVLQSAGSLSVALLALILSVLQITFFLRKPQFTWYGWGAAISAAGMLYALGVFLEYNTPAGPLNHTAGKLEFTAHILLIQSAYGFTFSYLGIKAKYYYLWAGIFHALVLAILWSGNYIVADEFVARSLYGLSRPFVEAGLGPLGPLFMLYIALAGIGVIVLWFLDKRTSVRNKIPYLAGLIFWLMLGIHDGLVAMGMPSAQYLMEYGFLGFALVTHWEVFHNYIDISGEDKYRVITEFANDGILIVQDEKAVFANPACSNFIGRPATGTGREDLIDIVTPEDRKKFLHYMGNLPIGSEGTINVRMMRSDKEKRIVAIRANAILYRNRPATMAIMRDITENIREHEALQTEKDKFSTTFYSAPYAMAISSPSDGRIIEVNESFADITGYTREEIKGKSTLALHIWDKDQDRTDIVQGLITNGRIRVKEVKLKKKSGENFTGLFSADFITLNDEQYILSSLNDVTERKRVEQALTRSEAGLAAAQSSARLGSWSIDQDMQNAFWSAQMFKMFHFDPAQGVPSIDEFVGIVHPDDRERIRQNLIRSVVEARPYKDEYRIIYSDGSMRWMEGQGGPIFDANGRIIQYEGTIQDITERKQTEEKLRLLGENLEQKVAERTKQLQDTQLALLNIVEDLDESSKNLINVNQSMESVNRELTAFSYSVSHDLRAPLRSIDGFSNVLLEDYGDKLDEKGKAHLARIRRATRHMGNLIDDLLNLSRVTQSEITMETFDLSTMARSIAETYLQKNPLPGLTLHIRENVLVRADRRLIHVMLTNLLDNAWKFTGGTMNPRIEFGKISDDDQEVLFIRDNGAGFDMAYREKLFVAFQRLHSVNEFPGTGIGLATVRRIINRHGGKIWAEGEVGKGATFFFTLPGEEISKYARSSG